MESRLASLVVIVAVLGVMVDSGVVQEPPAALVIGTAPVDASAAASALSTAQPQIDDVQTTTKVARGNEQVAADVPTVETGAEKRSTSGPAAALSKVQESISKYMDGYTHRWRSTNECNSSERDFGRQHLEELKLWPHEMNWLANVDGPGEGCDHAKTIYRPLVKGAPEDSLGTREFLSHWGVVYFYKDGSVRPTDLCLDVCDVNMGIDGDAYQALLAMWAIVDPIPIQQCTWKESNGDNYTKLSTLTEQRYDCDTMWKAQMTAWQQYTPKTWSWGRNCGQLVMQQVDTYHALDEAKAKHA